MEANTLSFEHVDNHLNLVVDAGQSNEPITCEVRAMLSKGKMTPWLTQALPLSDPKFKLPRMDYVMTDCEPMGYTYLVLGNQMLECTPAGIQTRPFVPQEHEDDETLLCIPEYELTFFVVRDINQTLKKLSAIYSSASCHATQGWHSNCITFCIDFLSEMYISPPQRLLDIMKTLHKTYYNNLIGSGYSFAFAQIPPFYFACTLRSNDEKELDSMEQAEAEP